MKLVLRYAFHELNLDRVGLEVIGYNKGGIRSYEKVGFQLEGRKRSMVYRDGQRYDLLIMGILHHEWKQHNINQKSVRTVPHAFFGAVGSIEHHFQTCDSSIQLILPG